jgi:hypothetical protein
MRWPLFKVDLTTDFSKKYTFNLFFAKDYVTFTNEIKAVGLDYLEENKIFCILLVTGDVEDALDYTEVLDEVDPKRESIRIFQTGLYLDNLEDNTVQVYIDAIYRSIVGDNNNEFELNIMWKLGEYE